MSINVYGGIMGSGKSYEVVSGPLLDGIAAGRRVVTNVDGIDEERIHEYLVEKRRVDLDKLGRIVHITTDRVNEPGFFPVELESAEGATVTPGLVEAGDLVVIDEAWKLWTSSEKMSKEHVAFFRMHRHFVHADTKLCCDVILMVQTIGDLPRMLKAVVELSFVMCKLKSLGAPTKYRVEMYEGWKQNAKSRIGTYLKSYKKEIFPLYKSYAGAAGKEATVDKRQNIFRDKRLWLFAGAVLILCLLGYGLLYRFFHPKPKTESVSAATAASKGSASAVLPGNPAQPSGGSAKPLFSDTWRIVGGFSANNESWVVVADQSGHLRVESPSNFQNSGFAQVGTIDGERVSTFSGGRAAGFGIGVTK
jgi:zona occludens toxin